MCLNPYSNGRCSKSKTMTQEELNKVLVLILILMEDALREGVQLQKDPLPLGLNPYSNGRCSKRLKTKNHENKILFVLILIIMEDALRERENSFYYVKWYEVLILILMEDALRGYVQTSDEAYKMGLNPYSNGRCSKSYSRR